LSRAPAPEVGASMVEEAEAYATRLLERFDYVGVLALELFDVEGRLYANEIAPRVHNSGHWTIEGARTSQFENHLRAIIGLPLGDTEALGPSAMLNLIGRIPNAESILAVPDAHLHDYGKEPRERRKVGHITLRAPDRPILEERVNTLRTLLV
jgi:5-(carboxyamino)imidazole ribonucleotide synthase